MTTGSDKSQSAIIQHRLPEFVQTNHPTMVAFVQAYYEWLESQKDSGYLRTPAALEGVSDVDATLDEFVADFKKEFLLDFPEQFAVNGDGNTVDVRKLIKNIKEFYRNKGTEKTYEFLFRILYDTAVEFYYPARDILRLSDGKWIQKYSIRCSNTLGNKIFDARGKTITQKNTATGAIVASGRVIDVVTFQLGNREISELFLTNINGIFYANTKTENTNYGGIEFIDNDSITRIEPRIYPVLKAISISSAGTGYRKGEKIVFAASGDSGVGASATIVEIDASGGVVKTRIDNFGVGYENSPTYSIDTAFGSGAVLSVTTGSTCVYPGYYSGSDGKLSSSKVMQDNHYYQNFSYVLLSEVVIDRYKEILRRIIHPSGMGMFGKVLINRCASQSVSTDALGSKTEIPIVGNYTPYTLYTSVDLGDLLWDERPTPYYPLLHDAAITGASGNPSTLLKYSTGQNWLNWSVDPTQWTISVPSYWTRALTTETTAPDGTQSAYKITKINATTSTLYRNFIWRSLSKSLTYSIYLKKPSSGGKRYVSLLIRNQNTLTNILNTNWDFDTEQFVTGATPTPAGSTITSAYGVATFESVGNGWYRFKLTVTSGFSANDDLYFYWGDSGSSSGDYYWGIGDSVYLWGIQVQEGTTLTDYIPTKVNSIYHRPYAIGFSPSGITGLKVWLDGTSLTAAGATTSTWRDRSGNGFTATAANTNMLPSISSMYGLYLTGSVGTAGSFMTTPSLGTLNNRTMFLAFTPFPVGDSVTRQRNSMVAGLQRSAHLGVTGSATAQCYQDHTICIDYQRSGIDSNQNTQPRIAAYYGIGNKPSLDVFYGTDGSESIQDILSTTASAANRKIISSNASSVVYKNLNDLEAITASNTNTSVVCSLIGEGYPTLLVSAQSLTAEYSKGDTASNNDFSTDARYNRYIKMSEYTIPEEDDGSYSFSMDQATDYDPAVLSWKAAITKNDGLNDNVAASDLSNVEGEWTWATMTDGATAALDLDFTTGTLDSRISFSRSSTGSYYGRKYNENNIFPSQSFGYSSGWILYSQYGVGAGATANYDGTYVLDNAAIAPDGTKTAAIVFLKTLGLSSSSDRSYLAKNVSNTSAIVGNSYTTSVWLRGKYGNERVVLRGVAGANGPQIDLTTTWQRYSVTQVASNTTPNTWAVGKASNYGGFTGDIVEVWGAQTTEGSELTPYIPTTTARVVQGQLSYASPNTARFHVDPVTGSTSGLLMEGESTNLFLRSAEIGTSPWTYAACTVTGTTIVAPDGTTSGRPIVLNDGSNSSSMYLFQEISVTGSTSYAFSCFLKPKTSGLSTRLRVETRNTGGTLVSNIFCIFDHATKSMTGQTLSGTEVWTNVGATAMNVGNDWHRTTVYGTSCTSAASIRLVLTNIGSDGLAITGNGISGVYAWGTQAEQREFSTSYIPTTSATASRSADSAVMTGNNFSSWYNPNGGSLFAEQTVRWLGLSANQSAVSLNESTPSSKWIGLGRIGRGSKLWVSNSTDQAYIGPSSFSPALNMDAKVRTAARFLENDFYVAANGSTASDISGSLPSPTELVIGNTETSSISAARIVNRIVYWPYKLTDDILLNLSKEGTQSPSRIFTPNAYKTHKIAIKDLKGGDVVRVWMSASENSGIKPLNTSLDKTKHMKLRNFTVNRAFGRGKNILTVNGEQIDSALANLDGITAGQRLVLGLGQNYFNGVIHEVLVYDRALNDMERETIEAYLYYRWKNNIISASGHAWNLPVSGLTNGYGIYPALTGEGGFTTSEYTNSLSLIGYPFFEINSHPNIALSEQGTYAARILSTQSSDFLGVGGTGSTGYWPEWTEGSTANRQNWAIGLSAEGSRHAILQYNTSSQFRKITANAFFDMKAGRQFDCKDEYVVEPAYPKISLNYKTEFANSSFDNPIYSNGTITFNFTTENAENLEYWTTDLLEVTISDGRGEYFYRPDSITSKTLSGFVSDGINAKQYTITIRLLDFYGKPIPDSENSVTFWFKYLSTAGTYDTAP